MLSELEALQTAFSALSEAMRVLAAQEADAKVREKIEGQLDAARGDFERLQKRLKTALETRK